MSLYHDVVYGNYPKSEYPQQLVQHLRRQYGLHPHWNYDGSEYYNRILEIGFGNEQYLKEFELCKDFEVYGIEFNKIYNNKSSVVASRTWDFGKDPLPYDDDSMYFIFTKSVIEHIPEADFFISECKRVLKPGGKIYILTPSWEYNWRDFYNDYTHVKPYHRKGLQDCLKINGFTNVQVTYFYHLPWLWERPFLLPVALLLRLFSKWKWRDAEETVHRINIRFSQEVQLLAIAQKYGRY